MTERVWDEDHEQRPNEKKTQLKCREQKMKKDLLDSKRKVKGMAAVDNPPRNLNGKKEGLYAINERVWGRNWPRGIEFDKLKSQGSNVRELTHEKKNRKFVQNQEGNGTDNFGMNGEFQELDSQIESPKSQNLEEPSCIAVNNEARKIVQIRIANNIP